MHAVCIKLMIFLKVNADVELSIMIILERLQSRQMVQQHWKYVPYTEILKAVMEKKKNQDISGEDPGKDTTQIM